jgi:hypothetical protein
MPLFPRPVVIVDAKDVRVAVRFGCRASRGELCSGSALGEAVRSVTVPRLYRGGRGLWFDDACDELRDVEGLTLLERGVGSRLGLGLAPKTAGSVGFVRALWRGGVLGRGVNGVRADERGIVLVSARLRGGFVLSARGAGVGEVDFVSDLVVSLSSWLSRE